MTATLSPLPVQKFFDSNGRPLVGGLLFTYEAGTTTKIATFVDAGGIVQNTNPIVLDYRGECQVWLDPLTAYKLTLAPPGDTDPPTKPIWTVDNVSVGLWLTQQVIGQLFYPRTQAEINANVTPVNYFYEPGYLYRYGTNTSPGTTDMQPALMADYAQAVQLGGTGAIYFPPDVIAIKSACVFGSAVNLVGFGGMPGGIGNARRPFSTILKQFTGDLFTWNGADGVSSPKFGSGGGAEGLRIVSDTGSAVTANGAGNCFVITGTTESQVASWVQLRHCIIEYAAARDCWSWQIVFDGTAIAPSVPGLETINNCFVTDIQTHNAASNGGAMKILGANVIVCDCSFHDASGFTKILVSGSMSPNDVPSIGVLFDNIDTSGPVALDYCFNVSWTGGNISGAVTNTANTGGRCLFTPGQNSFEFLPSSNLAGAAFVYIQAQHGVYTHATKGGVQSSAPWIAFNDQYVRGEIASRNDAVALIGVNASDRVLIAGDGSDIQLGRAVLAASGGGTATLGAIGSGPSATAMNCWLKFYDSAGNPVYLAGWR